MESGERLTINTSPVSRRPKIRSPPAAQKETTLSSRRQAWTRSAAEGASATQKRGTFGLAREKRRRTESEVRRERVAGCVGCHSVCRRLSVWWWMEKRSEATGITLREGGREGRWREGRKGGKEGRKGGWE